MEWIKQIRSWFNPKIDTRKVWTGSLNGKKWASESEIHEQSLDGNGASRNASMERLLNVNWTLIYSSNYKFLMWISYLVAFIVYFHSPASISSYIAKYCLIRHIQQKITHGIKYKTMCKLILHTTVLYDPGDQQILVIWNSFMSFLLSWGCRILNCIDKHPPICLWYTQKWTFTRAQSGSIHLEPCWTETTPESNQIWSLWWYVICILQLISGQCISDSEMIKRLKRKIKNNPTDGRSLYIELISEMIMWILA